MGITSLDNNDVLSQTWVVCDLKQYEAIAISSQPGSKYKTEYVYPKGTQFNVYEKRHGWLRCKDGWVPIVSNKGETLCKYVRTNYKPEPEPKPEPKSLGKCRYCHSRNATIRRDASVIIVRNKKNPSF